MNKFISFRMIFLAFLLPLLISCRSDDEESPPVVEEREYTLNSLSDPEIFGTITFTKQDEGATLVRIVLEGTNPGNSHPTHIHANSASQGGPIMINLSNVDGESGISETVVSQLDNGTAIDYEGLLNFNGHANVHLSPAAMSTLIAQGDIGSNSEGNP
jgi:hypothetical protein